jgi:2-pyrone-4,6-dicarboxylate lactonase
MTMSEVIVESLPSGSCDCHVHICGPFDRFPADLGSHFSPTREFPIELLLQMWQSIGVSRGVIAHAGTPETDNAVTFDALRRYPDQLRAVAILNPDVTDRRLDELTAAGFKGVRINLLRQDGRYVFPGAETGLEDLKSLAPRVAERGWHAQLWIETGDLRELAPELERLPLDFVIDHQGRTMADKTVAYQGFQWFCDRLKSGRYWCKLSGADRNTRVGAPYRDTEDFMRALVAANPDRMVWASDWPHLGHTSESLPDETVLIDLFNRCVPDVDIRRRILVDNAVRLYGFGD